MLWFYNSRVTSAKQPFVFLIYQGRFPLTQVFLNWGAADVGRANMEDVTFTCDNAAAEGRKTMPRTVQ
jgi:hypothetical protein